MKKMLLLSAALIAALTAPALAQRDKGRGDGPRAQQGQQDRSNRGGGFRSGQQAAPQVQQQAPQAQAQRNDNRSGFNRGDDSNNRNDGRGNFGRNNDGRPDFNRGGNDRNDFGRPGFGRNDDYNRGYNNRGYDNRRFSQYYRNWNSQSRFRAGVYYRPPGFFYRRWSYGDILPSLFWGSRYQLSNYYAYDLPRPPVGTVWVRYADDALLIDSYTGEVIQVSYNVFW